MSKKLVNVLYKKCFKFTVVKKKNKPQPSSIASILDWSCSSRGNDSQKITEVLWKDTLSESQAYIAMLTKLSELYDHVLDKASFFRKFVG